MVGYKEVLGARSGLGVMLAQRRQHPLVRDAVHAPVGKQQAGHLIEGHRRAELTPELGKVKGDEVFEIVPTYYPPVHESIFINEIGMVVGDKIMLRRANRFEVIATHKGGVLLRERDSGQIYPEKNSDIKKYYEDGWE